MVRRLILCSLASAGLFCGLNKQASAQIQPVVLDSQRTEDLYDSVLVKPKAAQTQQPKKPAASAGELGKGAVGLAKLLAEGEAAGTTETAQATSPAMQPAPAPFIGVNCAPNGCLPPAPFPPGIAPPPPIEPGVTPPVEPGTPPTTPAPGATTPPPSPGQATPPPSPSQAPPSQPSSNFAGANQPQLDFSAGFSSQGLLASRDVPAMIGDFFGSGASQQICIQPESYFFQGPDQLVNFQTGYQIRNFAPSGGGGFGFSTIDGFNSVSGGPNEGEPFFLISSVASTPLPNGTAFTGVGSGSGFYPPSLTPGSPVVVTDVLVNPGAPAPGTFIEIDQTQASKAGPPPIGGPTNEYIDAVTADVQTTQPGLQQQKNDYITTNGPGTFTDTGPGTVTVGPGYAILNEESGPGNGYENQYYIQQLESYTPDTSIYTPDPVLVTPHEIKVDIPGGAVASMPGMQVGRMKLTENTSPIPRDRVYVNYSYFDNTPLFPGGVNVNRVTPGIEKTFMNGNMSIEIRTPFASTLDNDIMFGGITNTNDTQFGNLTTYLKALLYDNEAWALSAGVGVAAPTASDANVIDAQSGRTLISVKNNAVHLLPFVGGAYVPNDRLFVQSILQFDVDLNGNPISATSFDQGMPSGNLSRIGNGRDQTLLYYDISMGYWFPVYLGPITRVAPIVEYHLNQTIQDGQNVSGQAGNTIYNFDGARGTSLSNGVVGLVASLNDRATMTVAYATPLGGTDQQFDGELRLFFNWFFGSNRPLQYGPALR